MSIKTKRETCRHTYWDLGYCIDCGIHSNDPLYAEQLRTRANTKAELQDEPYLGGAVVTPPTVPAGVQIDQSCGCTDPFQLSDGSVVLKGCDTHRDGRPVRLRAFGVETKHAALVASLRALEQRMRKELDGCAEGIFADELAAALDATEKP